MWYRIKVDEDMLSEAYCEMHAEDILYFIQREKEKGE